MSAQPVFIRGRYLYAWLDSNPHKCEGTYEYRDNEGWTDRCDINFTSGGCSLCFWDPVSNAWIKFVVYGSCYNNSSCAGDAVTCPPC